MVYIKSKEEIKIIKEGGRRLAAILRRLKEEVKPGVSTAYLEELAEKMIKEVGGRPAFKNYPMGGGIFFPSALCVSIDDEVVHGASLPDRILEEGSIVDLDIGMEWPIDNTLREKLQVPVNPHSKEGGFFTDMCVTLPVGKISKEAQNLLRVTEECLNKALKVIKPGKRINDLARVIERHAESNGFGVVRDLVGHGVGYYAHEEPDIFNFSIHPESDENLVLKEGMVIAVEPMINAGDWRVKMAANGYTFVTKDGSYSAHFEHTIAVTENGCEILTK
jgi:methionyl aminopeptidase